MASGDELESLIGIRYKIPLACLQRKETKENKTTELCHVGGYVCVQTPSPFISSFRHRFIVEDMKKKKNGPCNISWQFRAVLLFLLPNKKPNKKKKKKKDKKRKEKKKLAREVANYVTVLYTVCVLCIFEEGFWG